MSSAAFPEGFAIAAVVGWPLAAGLVLVLWSRARAAEHARREAVLDAELRELYREIEGRPVPERLALVVEALEEAAAFTAVPSPRPRVRTRGKTPSAVA